MGETRVEKGAVEAVEAVEVVETRGWGECGRCFTFADTDRNSDIDSR